MTYNYTKHGPFVNGASPGIDQTFLNDIETALLSLNPEASDPNAGFNASLVDQTGAVVATGFLYTTDPDNATSAASVKGTVSGQVLINQYISGFVTRLQVSLSNYKSGAAQTLKLPYNIAGPSVWQVTELQGGKVEALANGTAQTFSVQTTLAVGGGSQAPQTFMNSWSFGMCRTGFDTIRITVTGTTPATCMFTIEG